MIKILYIQNMSIFTLYYECFASMYICVVCACLATTEATRGHCNWSFERL